jgi:hypothetical protein
MTTLYWLSGTLSPDALPQYAHSSRQITGMALMLIGMPAYLIAMGIVARRRSLELVEQLRPLLPAPSVANDAQEAIRSALKQSWPIGTAIGLTMGLLNTNPIFALTESRVPAIDVSLSLGQLLLWCIIGLLLAQRTVTARAFSRLGEVVSFELFRLDRLRPLARAGTIDILVIAGALALSPLQSLDAEFRWYNYSFALAVAIPAAFFLLLWPLRTVHRRIREEKLQQLARVEASIDAVDRSDAPDDIARFESLLAHRERLRRLRTWPLGTALMSRLVVYLIIPPLAWAGAAVVEMFVNRLLEP